MSTYFSIIIPMYNRERFIARAIISCLNQEFEDFEVIVVDDGSSDKSVEVVKGCVSDRVKLICHNVNRGVGPARNTGALAATGGWVLFVDSDDELLPGALSNIHSRSVEVDESISRLQFMGKIDTGEISPAPPLKNELWNYIEYIKWMEECDGHQQDTTAVIRRETFEEIRFYDDRTLEGPYHLDFMKKYCAWTFPDVVALYHQDAENQLTKVDVKRTIEDAQYQAVSGELSLKNHGSALKRYAPRTYGKYISGLATLFYLSGNRLKGFEYSMACFKNKLYSFRNLAILMFGLLGPKPLAYLKYFRAILG